MAQNWVHQELAVERFKNKEYFGLLFDCGTGKTRTAIKIAEEKDMPVLVIAPKNLTGQWADAIREHGEKEADILIVEASKRNTQKFKARLDEFLAL